MNPNGNATRLPPPKHIFDKRFQKNVHKVVSSLLNGKIVDDNGNVIGRWLYSDGNVVLQFKSTSGGKVYIAGEYDPSQTYPDTTQGSQAIVFYTPDGGAPGTYYTLPGVTVPAGVTPDTGAPNWASFPTSPPAQWM